MPKKRTFNNLKSYQGGSSSNSQQASSGNGSDIIASVNERLSELRKLEGKDAAAKKRQLAELLNQRSVPQTPEVRRILGITESAPPKAKASVRFRERMRTPGPAPPKSWLAGSTMWTSTLALRSAKSRPRKIADHNTRNRPKQLLRFSRLVGLENDAVDQKPASLSHLALKAIAEYWDTLDEEDYPVLADLPLRLRLRLLSYIDYYGPSIDPFALQSLLQGHEAVRVLDLAGLVGHRGLSLKKVMRLLEQTPVLIHDSTTQAEESVADSWDAEDALEGTLQPSPRASRFSQLTHLCLSHPAPFASWRDLLSLSKLTPQVTHLSLAYWPRPTLTPNLATATVSSQRGPDITAGGSHFYSTMDQDMTEPASLLRQLSNNVLCLEWLDLEGCQDWVPALAKLAQDTISVPVDDDRPRHDDWTAGSHTVPSIFASNWKNLMYIRCAQGWLPSLTGVQGLSGRRETAIDALLVDGIGKHLVEQETSMRVVASTQDQIDIEKKKARMWLESEYKLTYTCMRINSARRAHGCKPVGVDFRWIQRHVSSI